MMRVIMALGVILLMGVSTSSPFIKDVQAREITSGEVVRVQKLNRDMKNVRLGINQTGPSIFQNNDEVKKYKQSFARFTTAIKRYNEFSHAEVKAAQAEYLALRKVIMDEFARAQQQMSTLGDVQAQLRGIEKDLFAKRAPKPLQAPFSEATAKAWVSSAVAAKQQALDSIKSLQDIGSHANLEKNNRGTVQQGAPYDKQDVNRLTRIANKTIQEVDQGQKATLASIKAQLEGVERELPYYIKLDPNNESHIANAFLKEGAPEKAQIFFSDQEKIVMSAVYFLKQFGKEPSLLVQSLLSDIASARAIYSQGLEIAAGEYRLPEPKSTDQNLLNIAKTIIEKPRYGFAERGPIVLTSKGVVDKERTESEEKFNDIDVSLSGEITLTGTKTTWTYKWQEFKFATPIKAENGDWHVWWITARKYSSGGMRTPIGEWISGKSSQGSVIRAENF